MRQRRLKNEINVVPYIDVMLVLLVIFMVATPMMTTGSVDLPSSSTAPQKPDKYVKVQIKDDGALSVFDVDGKEKQVKGIKELKAELAILKEADEKVAILVAGAKETQYKNVIEVLDEAKRAGFQKVGLETGSK
ncbi:ExbD/TolR family protein [Dechloromonas denitrificans]|jgi:biopolymer transport protein TolR|uniref:ExbD/TolR family protein n=1 Tax=Azonexaceae TaxID=2008795 RepID=UPI001CF92BDF|nr:ExbD/TolR family protein [Dechloromonas denitrificans]UCV03570.1 ExbD/TolR family protein [Dechloromonas denitrificans]UCV07831.1 ExbD/TolR family protein [Dechloromonas denitrificans]